MTRPVTEAALRSLVTVFLNLAPAAIELKSALRSPPLAAGAEIGGGGAVGGAGAEGAGGAAGGTGTDIGGAGGATGVLGAVAYD